MLTLFCRKFREFLFLHFGQVSANFRHIGEIFPGIVLASKFCLMGVALFGAGALQKTPSNTSCLIYFDIDNDNWELAVLALARIMCAYIHSQNGPAILAQAWFSTEKLAKKFCVTTLWLLTLWRLHPTWLTQLCLDNRGECCPLMSHKSLPAQLILSSTWKQSWRTMMCPLLAWTPRTGNWWLRWWLKQKMQPRTSCRANMCPWRPQNKTSSHPWRPWRRPWQTLSWARRLVALMSPLPQRVRRPLQLPLALRPPPGRRVWHRCLLRRLRMCRWMWTRKWTHKANKDSMGGSCSAVLRKSRPSLWGMSLSRWSPFRRRSSNWWRGWTRRRSLTSFRSFVIYQPFQQWALLGWSRPTLPSRHKSSMMRSCDSHMSKDVLALELEMRAFRTGLWAPQGPHTNALSASLTGLLVGQWMRRRCASATRKWLPSRRQLIWQPWSRSNTGGSFLSLAMASLGCGTVPRNLKLRLPLAVTSGWNRWFRTWSSKRSMRWTSVALRRLLFAQQITLRHHSRTISQALTACNLELRYSTGWWMRKHFLLLTSPDLRFPRTSSMGRRLWFFIRMLRRLWRWRQSWPQQTFLQRRLSIQRFRSRRWMTLCQRMQTSSMICRVERSRWKTLRVQRCCAAWICWNSKKRWRGSFWKGQDPSRALLKLWHDLWLAWSKPRSRTGSMKKRGGCTSPSSRLQWGPQASGGQICRLSLSKGPFALWRLWGSRMWAWIHMLHGGNMSRPSWTWCNTSWVLFPHDFWLKFLNANWISRWLVMCPMTGRFPWRLPSLLLDPRRPRWLCSTTCSTCAMVRSGSMLADGPNMRAWRSRVGPRRNNLPGKKHWPWRWGPIPRTRVDTLWSSTPTRRKRLRTTAAWGFVHSGHTWREVSLPGSLRLPMAVCLGKPPHCGEATWSRSTWWRSCWRPWESGGTQEDPEGDQWLSGGDAAPKAIHPGRVESRLEGGWHPVGGQAFHLSHSSSSHGTPHCCCGGFQGAPALQGDVWWTHLLPIWRTSWLSGCLCQAGALCCSGLLCGSEGCMEMQHWAMVVGGGSSLTSWTTLQEVGLHWWCNPCIWFGSRGTCGHTLLACCCLWRGSGQSASFDDGVPGPATSPNHRGQCQLRDGQEEQERPEGSEQALVLGQDRILLVYSGYPGYPGCPVLVLRLRLLIQSWMS